MVMYRPFESWAPNSDWTVGLPAGEEACAVAAGESLCALATSRQLLRVFSAAGKLSCHASLSYIIPYTLSTNAKIFRIMQGAI